MTHLKLLIIVAVTTCSCVANNSGKIQLTDQQAWKLSYRMFKSSLLEEHELGVKQYDSLLHSTATLEPKFMHIGIELLLKKGEQQRAIEVFNRASKEAKMYICSKGQLSEIVSKGSGENPCAGIIIEKQMPSHPEVQEELVIMFYNDQTVRGVDMSGLAKDFSLNVDSIAYNVDGLRTDSLNKEKLKNIIEKYGFPTKDMVGEVGMESIFFVVQHADQDKEFQKSQLPYIENAVKRGDLEGQKYAYLYDRIRINAGEPQLYGTQFSKVDVDNKTVELAPVEDIENLDKRRKAMGMMPVQLYKEIMLSSLKK